MRTRQNPPKEWAKTTAPWLRESEYYKLPWIKKFVRRLEAATTDAQYRSLKVELERFLRQLEVGPGLEGAGPSVEDINAALLTSTLGLGESGLAMPGARGPVRGQTPHAPPTRRQIERERERVREETGGAYDEAIQRGLEIHQREAQRITGAAHEWGEQAARAVREAEPDEDPAEGPEEGLHIKLEAREDGNVNVWCNDVEGARNDQSIQGSRWEFDGDLAYAIITNTPDLDDELRAEGYVVDISEWHTPATLNRRLRTGFAAGYQDALLADVDGADASLPLASHTQRVILGTCRAFCDSHETILRQLYAEGHAFEELGKAFFQERNRHRSRIQEIREVARNWPEYYLAVLDHELVGASALDHIRNYAGGGDLNDDAGAFVRGYLEAALGDLEAQERDRALSDIIIEHGADLHWTSIQRASQIALAFLDAHRGDLDDFGAFDHKPRRAQGRVLYWNSNGHGVTFMDDIPHTASEDDDTVRRLADAAHASSPFSLYRGDDQLIWYTNG